MASQQNIDAAQRLINEHRFLMLSKSWCPDCHYTYKIWDKYQVADKVYLIELDKFEDQNEASELEKGFTHISGRKWVPSIFFNGEFLGTEQDLKNWDNEGSLEVIFKEEGLLNDD